MVADAFWWGDVRRARQVLTLAAGWAREPGLTTSELRVLRHQRRRPLDTVRAAYLTLAALGGHRGRKRNGPPGW